MFKLSCHFCRCPKLKNFTFKPHREYTVTSNGIGNFNDWFMWIEYTTIRQCFDLKRNTTIVFFNNFNPKFSWIVKLYQTIGCYFGIFNESICFIDFFHCNWGKKQIINDTSKSTLDVTCIFCCV